MPSIPLPPILDLPAATRLAETLRTATGGVTLDAAAVERIGVAGLQVLLSARLHGLAAGAATIEAPSAALIAAARTAGADALLLADR